MRFRSGMSAVRCWQLSSCWLRLLSATCFMLALAYLLPVCMCSSMHMYTHIYYARTYTCCTLCLCAGVASHSFGIGAGAAVLELSRRPLRRTVSQAHLATPQSLSLCCCPRPHTSRTKQSQHPESLHWGD